MSNYQSEDQQILLSKTENEQNPTCSNEPISDEKNYSLCHQLWNCCKLSVVIYSIVITVNFLLQFYRVNPILEIIFCYAILLLLIFDLEKHVYKFCELLNKEYAVPLLIIFDNFPLLVFTILCLMDNYTELLVASIIGTIVTNNFLILGISITFGGIKNGIMSIKNNDNHILQTNLIIFSELYLLFFSIIKDTTRTTTINLFAGCSLILFYVTYCIFLIRHNEDDVVFTGRIKSDDIRDVIDSRSGESSVEVKINPSDNTINVVPPEKHYLYSDVGKHLYFIGILSTLIIMILWCLLNSLERAHIGDNNDYLGYIMFGFFATPLVLNTNILNLACSHSYHNSVDTSINIVNTRVIKTIVFTFPLLILLSCITNLGLITMITKYDFIMLTSSISIFLIVSKYKIFFGEGVILFFFYTFCGFYF